MRSTRLFPILISSTLMLALPACGSDKKSQPRPVGQVANDSPSKGQPVEPDDVLFTPGLWRSTFFTTRSKVSAGHSEVSSGSMTASSVYLVQVRDDGSVLETVCSEREQRVVQRGEWSYEFDADFCSGETPRVLGEHDENQVLYRTFCGETLVVSIEFVKLSDEPAFNIGSFLLDSDQFQGVSIDHNICGQLTRMEHEVADPETESTKIVVHQVEVSVPYGDSFLTLTINAQNIGGAGEYAIGAAEPGQQPAGGVSATLASHEFGTTADGPVEIMAESGQIKVLELGEFAVSVEFDFVTESGDAVNGSFALNLK